MVSFGNNNNERIISALAQAHLGLVKGKPMLKQYSSTAVQQAGTVCNKALKTNENLVQWTNRPTRNSKGV